MKAWLVRLEARGVARHQVGVAQPRGDALEYECGGQSQRLGSVVEIHGGYGLRQAQIFSQNVAPALPGTTEQVDDYMVHDHYLIWCTYMHNVDTVQDRVIYRKMYINCIIQSLNLLHNIIFPWAQIVYKIIIYSSPNTGNPSLKQILTDSAVCSPPSSLCMNHLPQLRNPAPQSAKLIVVRLCLICSNC